MRKRFNAETGRGDWVLTEEEVSALCLLINQASPQTIINGAPQFNEGAVIKQDRRIYLDGV